MQYAQTLSRVESRPDLWPSLIEELSVPDNFRRLVGEIKQSPDLLARSLEGSYKHVIGFTKIVLLESTDSCLRLNLWDQTGFSDEENPHNHTFPFSTKIISGSYLSTIWERSSSNEGQLFEEFLRVPGENGRNKTEEYGEARLVESFSRTYSQGDSYSLLDTEVIHSIKVAGDQTAITMLVKGKRERDRHIAHIFATEATRDMAMRTSGVNDGKPLTEAEFDQKIELAIAKIDEAFIP